MDILYNRFVGPQESLPYSDPHMSPTDAQSILLAFPELA